MSTVTNNILIRGEPGAVFDLVTTAKYWTQWHPATVAVGGQIDKPMRLGDVIRERARIGGTEAENDWTVSEWKRPSRVVLAMPRTRLGDLSITYTFSAVKDEVDFSRTLVFDATGFPIATAALLEKQMQGDSRIAAERIKLMVETLLGTAAATQ